MDRYYATIEFGGALRRDQLDELADAIVLSEAKADEGQPPFRTRQEVLDWLAVDGRHQAAVRLQDDEAPRGCFEELERTLMRLKLTWKRDSEVACGEPAGVAFWRPPWRKPRTLETNVRQEPTVTVTVLRRMLRLKDPRAIADTLQRLVNQHYVPTIPPLTLEKAPKHGS